MKTKVLRNFKKLIFFNINFAYVCIEILSKYRNKLSDITKLIIRGIGVKLRGWKIFLKSWGGDCSLLESMWFWTSKTAWIE